MRSIAIAMSVGVWMWTASVQAQSSPPAAGGPLASQYLDAERGLALPDAIHRALDREPSVRAARTEIDVARGVRLQASRRPNPSVSFMQQQEPGGTDHQTRVETQWPLDLFRRSGREAVADRAIEATEQSVADRERRLAAQVRDAYGQVAVVLRDLSIDDELIEATGLQRAAVHARVEQGTTPAIEGNMLDVEVSRLEAERLLQVARAESALIDLKRLIGASPDEPLRVRETLDALVANDAGVDRGSPSADGRPDVREAEARVREADARIDRAERDGRVDVSLVGSYMRTDAGFPQLGIDPAGGLERVRGQFNYMAAGAMVTLPLRDRRQGEMASARAARAGAALASEAVQLAARAEIASARVRDINSHRAVAAYRDGAVTQARRNLDVVRQTYELGRATIFDVLSEQRRYLDLERAYSNTLKAAYDARAALRAALGEVR